MQGTRHTLWDNFNKVQIWKFIALQTNTQEGLTTVYARSCLDGRVEVALLALSWAEVCHAGMGNTWYTGLQLKSLT